MSAFVNRSLTFVLATLSIVACSGGDDSGSSPTDGGVDGARRDSGKTIFDAGPPADTGAPIPQVCSAVSPDAGTVYPDAVAIEGGGTSYSLVHVNNALYWSGFDGVTECVLDETEISCDTEQTIYGAGTSEGALATDGHLLYYATQSGGIVSFSFDGFGATTILAGPLSLAPLSLVVAGGKIFWTEPSAGIQSCEISNCAATSAPFDAADVFTSGSLGMTTDGTHLYWCYYSDIYVADLDGSNLRPFASVSPQPAGMFVDSCNLYWGSYSDTQSLSACALDDCANTITPLAHVAQGYAFGVTADPTEVFFSNHLAGDVYRVALTP